MAERRNFSSGTPWESQVGYSRAVKIGNRISVAGTTASDEEGRVIGVGDVYAQTHYILDKIERVLAEAGASLRDVVRTRMFVTDISQWQEVGRAHGERFGDIRPAATMVEVSRLIDPQHLIEIEAEVEIADVPRQA